MPLSWFPYIDYVTDTDTNTAQQILAKQFVQKKENILYIKNQDNTEKQLKTLNQLLDEAQKDVNVLFDGGQLEQDLVASIEAAMNKANEKTDSMSLNSMIQKMASNMSKVLEGSEEAIKVYSEAYGQLIELIKVVSSKKQVTMSAQQLNKMLYSLEPTELKQRFKEIGNPLGYLGEVSGMIMLENIADNLLETTFKNQSNLKIEITNVGEVKGLNTNRAIQTDNLMLIRDENGNVVYQLNLSNKLSADFSPKKNVTRSIKLRTTTINIFLQKHPDWSGPIYNLFSYHLYIPRGHGRGAGYWKRVDYYNNDTSDKNDRGVERDARRAIGAQMIYDYFYGTRDTFRVNNEDFNDEVQLVAYGTKIMASQNILRQALFDKSYNANSNLIQIETNAKEKRKKWWKHPNEGKIGDISFKSSLSSILDAQNKINGFELRYNKSLNFSEIVQRSSV